MNTASEILAPARAATPQRPEGARTLERTPEWRAVFATIDAAVLAQLDAIADADEARGLMAARAAAGVSGAGAISATDARLVGHRLGALSERCVEAVTFDGLFPKPASALAPLWRAVCDHAPEPPVASLLAGVEPAAGITDATAAERRLADDARPLDEARFEPPTDAMWAPVERIIVACVDTDLEQRFGHPVEY